MITFIGSETVISWCKIKWWSSSFQVIMFNNNFVFIILVNEIYFSAFYFTNWRFRLDFISIQSIALAIHQTIKLIWIIEFNVKRTDSLTQFHFIHIENMNIVRSLVFVLLFFIFFSILIMHFAANQLQLHSRRLTLRIIIFFLFSNYWACCPLWK